MADRTKPHDTRSALAAYASAPKQAEMSGAHSELAPAASRSIAEQHMSLERYSSAGTTPLRRMSCSERRCTSSSVSATRASTMRCRVLFSPQTASLAVAVGESEAPASTTGGLKTP